MTSLSRKLLPSTSALAAFDSVARLGSFSLAADELSLTQGAISRQLRAWAIDSPIRSSQTWPALR